MEKFIKYNFKDVDYLYCPYSELVLRQEKGLIK